jgi:hypothetical protein
MGESGADIRVTYCRTDTPSSDWLKLTSDQGAPNEPAAAKLGMTVYDYPDGTGSIQLPEGWKTSAQTCIRGVQIQGPADQLITLGQNYTVFTPDSFSVQLQTQYDAECRKMGVTPPKPMERLVAPYTGPVDALKNLVPQFSQMSQRRGGPVITLDKILEPPKPAKNDFPNGQAARLYYAVTRTTGGVPTHYRAQAWIETWGATKDGWCMYCTELAAPDATFDQDLPVMTAIVYSQKLNTQAVQRATNEAIAGQNRYAAAILQGNASQQAAFDGYLKSVQHSQIIQNRSVDDFDEIIRGTRDVKNTSTGESQTVPLSDAGAIVDNLNRQGGGTWVQVPLRDKMDPLSDH